jgi:hypothetical protein
MPVLSIKQCSMLFACSYNLSLLNNLLKDAKSLKLVNFGDFVLIRKL